MYDHETGRGHCRAVTTCLHAISRILPAAVYVNCIGKAVALLAGAHLHVSLVCLLKTRDLANAGSRESINNYAAWNTRALRKNRYAPRRAHGPEGVPLERHFAS